MENINAAAKECLGQKTVDDKDLGEEIQRNGMDLAKRISAVKNSNENWKNMFSKIDTGAIEGTLDSQIRKKLEIARSAKGDKKFEACANIISEFGNAGIALSNKKSADAYTKKTEPTLDPAIAKKDPERSGTLRNFSEIVQNRHEQIRKAGE